MGEEYKREVLVVGSVPSLGPVVLFDDMEGVLKWVKGGTGGDDVLEKSSTVAYNGSASLHVKTRTTNPAGNDVVNGDRLTYRRHGLRYRFECLWRCEDVSKLLVSGFSLESLFEGTVRKAAVRYSTALGQWQYLPAGGSYDLIPGTVETLFNLGWNRILLEWDESANEYVRFASNHIEVDMSGTSIYTASDGAQNHMKILTSLMAAGASPVEGYYDDFLVLTI